MRTQYRIRSESDLKVASLYPRGDNRTILVYFRLPHGYPKGGYKMPIGMGKISGWYRKAH
jgi:hypothetical protein